MRNYIENPILYASPGEKANILKAFALVAYHEANVNHLPHAEITINMEINGAIGLNNAPCSGHNRIPRIVFIPK